MKIENWKEVTIGDVATIIGGGTPSTLNPSYWNGDIQWFTPAELNESKKYVSKSERTITEQGLKESSAKLLPKGTVLLTTRASIGLTAILENPACTNQGFQSLIAKDICCNDFLYYIIPLIKDEMLSRASGSTFAEISAKKLSTITFPLPTLPEQQRIAKALSDVDALISTTEKLIQKKKNIKQGTMQNLLTGKKRLPGFAKSTNYKQSELGPIPEDWEVKSLGEICDVCDGTHDSPIYYDYGYPFITSKNLINGMIDFTDIQYISKNDYDKINERSKVDKNDILFSMIGTIVKSVLVLQEPNFAIKNVALFKNTNKCNQLYLKHYLDSDICYSRMSEDAKGSTQTFIPLGYFRTFLVPFPPLAEQTAIANVLSSMDKEIETLNTKLEKYRNLKTAMMQQLLTGKIRLVK